MARKLKVYRTSAGFSDAYIAAPSQKAALEAWGADVNLFARGMAEEVTDPALMEQPLAHPGEVLTVSCGDLAAHLKALEGRPPAKRTPMDTPVEMQPAKKPTRKKRPQPGRDALNTAEQALAEAERRLSSEARQLEQERDAAERALARHQKKMDKELSALTRKRDAAREAYDAAVERWSG